METSQVCIICSRIYTNIYEQQLAIQVNTWAVSVHLIGSIPIRNLLHDAPYITNDDIGYFCSWDEKRYMFNVLLFILIKSFVFWPTISCEFHRRLCILTRISGSVEVNDIWRNVWPLTIISIFGVYETGGKGRLKVKLEAVLVSRKRS